MRESAPRRDARLSQRPRRRTKCARGRLTGKLLIDTAYQITMREGKVGSPEKPLSDLGQLSFRSYWTQILLQALSAHRGNLSIGDISSMTAIKTEDIISTLQARFAARARAPPPWREFARGPTPCPRIGAVAQSDQVLEGSTRHFRLTQNRRRASPCQWAIFSPM